MAQVSPICPHCHASASADQIAGEKCLTCGAQLANTAELSESPTSRPAGKFADSSFDSQSVDVGRLADLSFLSPARGPGELGWLGPYRVLGRLGAGGMGIVFKAEDQGLRRHVALKVLRPEYAREPGARARFMREARAAAAVEHDHIVPIFQIAEAHGTAYLAMPLLRGESLSATLKRGVPPLSESVRIARETAEGLAAAHGAGMIHRDIKPGNIWLEGNRRRVRILDFGLARVTAESAVGDQTLTREGAVVGTPAYMSPEQARGFKVDIRSDLFSLGVVLYQLVTGQLPFRGSNSTNVLMAIVMEEPRPPVLLNPGIPIALNDLILSLLAKDPAYRPQTAENVAQTLANIESGLSVVPLAEAADSGFDNTAFTEFAFGSETAVEPPRPQPKKRTAPRARPSNRRALYLSLAGVAIVLVAAGLIVWQMFGSPARGTLVIESEEPTAEVIVRKDGEIVRTRTREREIRLRAGDYSVELADGRDKLRIGPDHVSISHGTRETVWISKRSDSSGHGRGEKEKEKQKERKKDPPKVDPPKPSKSDVLVINGPTPPGGSLPPYRSYEPLPPWELPKGTPAPAVHPFTASEAKKFQEAWAKHIAKPVTMENKIGMTLALIPPGEFDFPLTDASTAHVTADVPAMRVRLTRPIYLGTTEVTVGQFEAFVKATEYKTEAEASGEGGWVIDKMDPKATWRKPYTIDNVDPRHPVVQISWNDAVAFCEWLSKQEGATYRLPTEAEWRFAARAGSKRKFGPADTVGDFHFEEWTADDPVGGGEVPYRPVGQKKANAFGLYDMLGNVNEWSLDATRPEAARYLNPIDPVGPLHDAALMGGDFTVGAANISPELRRWQDTRSHRWYTTGFRVVCEPGPAKLDIAHAPKVRPGQPLSTRALVTRPEKIAGLRSWSVELMGPEGNVQAVAWSPIGDRIATSHTGDYGVRLWDRSGNLVSLLLGHEGLVTWVGFSPDGKRLGTWAGDGVRVWDVASGTCEAVFPTPPPAVGFSTDGASLVCVTPTGSGKLDIATGRYTGPNWPGFPFVALSPDQTLMLVSTNAANTPPAVWKVSPREKVADLKVLVNGKEQEPVGCWAVAWSPDGKWLAAGRYTNPYVIHVWDAKTFELKATLPVGNDVAAIMAWSPDSRRLAIAGSGIWDALEGKKIADLDKNPFAWSPKGNELIQGSLFRSPVTGQVLQSLSGRGQAISGPVSVSPDGKFLIDATARTVRLRDAETGDVKNDLTDLATGCGSVWSPTGDRVAVWIGAAPVRIVDPQTGGLRLELKDAINIRRVAWSPDGKHIATVADRDINIWETGAGTRVQSLSGHSGAVCGLVWSPDGKILASAALDTTIRLWNPLEGKPIKNFGELPEPNVVFPDFQPLGFSPDGQTLWFIRNTSVYPLDIRTHRSGPPEVMAIQNPLIGIVTAADGKLLAKDSSEWVAQRAGDPAVKLVLGPGLGLGVPWTWLPDSRRFLAATNRGAVGYDTFTRSRLGSLFPLVGGEYWLVIGPTGHYRGTAGVESHIVFVAMHDDGSQRTYTPAAFTEKFGWKNNSEQATLLKLDSATAKLVAPPAQGYWGRMAALKPKGARFWRADGTEMSGPDDLPAGLDKMEIVSPAGVTPLGDSDVEALRNLASVEGALRLQGVGISDTALAKALGFATFERISELHVVDTPAANETAAAACALPNLKKLTFSGTQITDVALTSLKSAKKLVALDLRRSRVTEGAIKALAAATPTCRIESDYGVIDPTK